MSQTSMKHRLRVAWDSVAMNWSHPLRPVSPRYYNITASDDRGFIWFRVAKVATRSILSVLREKGVPISLHESDALYQKGDKPLFRFSLVRNPWDRLVSCYKDKVVGKKKMYEPVWGRPFAQYVQWLGTLDLSRADRHVRLQSRLMPVEEMDFIGRFENLAADVSHIFGRIGLEGASLPHLNKTAKSDFRTFYDEASVQRVRELYQEDIERFGYTY